MNRIAVVGLSDRPSRDSYRISRHLLEQGYTILPVNPKISGVFGQESYKDLVAVPPPVEIVNIFRRREHVPAIVDMAIETGARAVWMQVGVVDEASAARARDAGLLVVMNRCIAVEHSRHFG